MSLKIIFAGTPPIAATHLQALITAGHSIIGVYTQPDRPSGRGKKLQASAVKNIAIDHGIPVYQPLNFKSPDAVATLAALKPDLMIVVAYGLLLPQVVLDTPRLGCINVHASLLPRWRGAAPIERAIEAGDNSTGITIMQMDAGLDTGAMLSIHEMPITDNTTGDSLRLEMSSTGSQALLATLDLLQSQQRQAVPQDDVDACYARKLLKEEALLDWQLPAHDLARKIRAFNSANVCYGIYNGERIKVWQATPLVDNHHRTAGEILDVSKNGITVACGVGMLQLQQLQLPNANKMDVAAILNGKKDFFVVGHCFA